ncbi:hypothetical protein V8G54_000676 [Vigna mungo]|uniref:Uncharacterized protein n=1 Tax=Vigna mungo TaxID=3915 RepID=A0AAQ3P7I4_VIGMU
MARSHFKFFHVIINMPMGSCACSMTMMTKMTMTLPLHFGPYNWWWHSFINPKFNISFISWTQIMDLWPMLLRGSLAAVAATVAIVALVAKATKNASNDRNY